ncbi:MAG: site-specific integrase, partial [Alphaproteobacteria bacterium]|nr:site-specific integrase [Alphaproteobacteria bacterium]
TQKFAPMDKSTFSILFIMQKGKPNAEGNAPIFARITINHQMTHLATRYYLPPERWLPKEGRTVGRTKEEKEVNAYLDNLRGLIFAKYNEMFLAGEVVTARKLKCRLISKDEKSMTLLDLFDDYIKDYSKLVGVSKTKKTCDRYILTRRRIEEFIQSEYKRTDISVNEVNPKFINGFEIFLRTQYKLSNNYVMKMIQRFRSIYQVAIDDGWANKNPFVSFKLKFEYTERGYLTLTELTNLMNKQLPSKRLEQIRDVFVFSCFTGLAYCDAQALTAEHIIVGPNGTPWLRTHRQKTSAPVDVDLADYK